MQTVAYTFTRAVCFLFLSSLPASAIAGEPQLEILTARDVLDRMAKTYAGCKSYYDLGAVKGVFTGAYGVRSDEKPFTTAFIRPDRFRFEYRNIRASGELRYIVWRKGSEVQTWWDVRPGILKPDSLARALAGAAGVSSGSAIMIPSLLMPEEVRGRRLSEMTDPKRVEDANLGTVECFRIEGSWGDRPMTLWIDKKTFLVRKIVQQGRFPDFQVEETTTLEPVIDEPIADKLLEFNAPRQK